MKIKNQYNIYQSIEQKNFKSSLFQFVKNEYGFALGKLALERFCEDIEKLANEHYPAKDYLRIGQMLWYGVSEDEKPSYGKKISETKMVPLALTIISDNDIEDFKRGMKLSDLKKKVMRRLFHEAKNQKGVLAEVDVKAILKMSLPSISKSLLSYEKETGKIIPRRGTVHDMGRSLTHKRIICQKRFVNRYSALRIARETNHSLEAVDKYIHDFRRVKYCMLKDMDEINISYVLKMSKSLVKEYLDIIRELDIKSNKAFDSDLLEHKIKLNRKKISKIKH
ncbi:MAG: DUF1670 domain-containing protein [Bacteroidetes bacterium]|nr:DUF1670 domain-containing protein [Bacteroidota bacterium]